MTAQRSSLDSAFETTLSSSITSSDTTIPVGSTGELSAPCYICIDPENDTKREYVDVDDTVNTDTSFVLSGSGQRGLEGNATSHDAGTVVRCVPTEQHFRDIFDYIEAHASRHFDGGADEINPADIGASATGHSHSGVGDHADEHEPGGSDTMDVDAAAGTGSLRTLGSGATQAAAGDHGHSGGVQMDSGTYTGDGTANRTISIGFTPTLVYLVNEDVTPSATDFFAWLSTIGTSGTRGLGLTGDADSNEVQANTAVDPTAGGFVVDAGTAGANTNRDGDTYRYVAFG